MPNTRKRKGDGKAWGRRVVAHIHEHGPSTFTELVAAVPGNLHQTSYNRIIRRLVDEGVIVRTNDRPFHYTAPTLTPVVDPVSRYPEFDPVSTADRPATVNGGPLVTLAVYPDGVRMSHADAIRILAAMGGD